MPLKLAMLGACHTHAAGMVKQIAEHPDEFTLLGFHDPDPAVVEKRRRDWCPLVPGLRVYDTPSDLLNEQLDGVIVEGRVYENLELARLALERGRPVMLEKPAGDRLAQFERLIDLARKGRLHLQLIYLFRYMPAIRALRACAARGELGRIYEFRARLPKDLATYDDFVEELKPYKGGMFFEMAGHVIDLMVTLLGQPSQIHGFLAHHHVAPPASFVDNAVAIFGFENAWGIIEVPALEVAPFARRIETYGTGGAFVISHLGSGHLPNRNVQSIEVYRKGNLDWERSDLAAEPLQITDLREFAAVIAGKKEPDYSLEHDFIVQQALLQSCHMT